MGLSSLDPDQANQAGILSRSVCFSISISLFLFPPVLDLILILVEKTVQRQDSFHRVYISRLYK